MIRSRTLGLCLAVILSAVLGTGGSALASYGPVGCLPPAPGNNPPYGLDNTWVQNVQRTSDLSTVNNMDHVKGGAAIRMELHFCLQDVSHPNYAAKIHFDPATSVNASNAHWNDHITVNNNGHVPFNGLASNTDYLVAEAYQVIPCGGAVDDDHALTPKMNDSNPAGLGVGPGPDPARYPNPPYGGGGGSLIGPAFHVLRGPQTACSLTPESTVSASQVGQCSTTDQAWMTNATNDSDGNLISQNDGTTYRIPTQNADGNSFILRIEAHFCSATTKDTWAGVEIISESGTGADQFGAWEDRVHVHLVGGQDYRVAFEYQTMPNTPYITYAIYPIYFTGITQKMTQGFSVVGTVNQPGTGQVPPGTTGFEFMTCLKTDLNCPVP